MTKLFSISYSFANGSTQILLCSGSTLCPQQSLISEQILDNFSCLCITLKGCPKDSNF